jgi:hypothetical protein
MRLVSAAAAFVGLWLAFPASQASKPEVVARAIRYVDDFVGRFSSVVAEERYVQETRNPRRRRELRSDFLLAMPPGSQQWFQFRDVFEVDGMPVRDRAERLSKLFLEAPARALERSDEVNRESSRHNLADVGTLNKPLIAISFLQSQYADRLRFSVGRIDKEVGPGVRLVLYQEWVTPTILRSGQANGNFAAHGRFWIDEATGRVLKTELLLGGSANSTLALAAAVEVVTLFRFDVDLQVIVPIEMRERHQFRDDEMTGVATYGRFRRFGVQTDEKITPP